MLAEHTDSKRRRFQCRWLGRGLVFVMIACPGMRPESAGALQVRRTVRAAEPLRVSPYRVDTLWQVGGSENRGGVEIGSGMGLSVDQEGRIFISDGRRQLVHVLDSAGRMLRTLGRAGDGPGEFRLPSRVTVGPDQHIFVLDEYWARINEFGADLGFLRSIQLQPKINIRTLTVTGTEFIVSGTERGGRGGLEIVHRFSRETGVRVASYGKQVDARSSEITKLLPAGPLFPRTAGGWWYASPGPYEIQLFDGHGNIQLRVERPNRFLPAVEEAYSVSSVDGRLSFRTSPHPVTAKIFETRQGMLVHQVIVNAKTVVTDEYVLEGTGSEAVLRLVKSWIQEGMPILDVEVGPGLYVVNTTDRDGTSGVALIRLTPRK